MLRVMAGEAGWGWQIPPGDGAGGWWWDGTGTSSVPGAGGTRVLKKTLQKTRVDLMGNQAEALSCMGVYRTWPPVPPPAGAAHRASTARERQRWGCRAKAKSPTAAGELTQHCAGWASSAV